MSKVTHDDVLDAALDYIANNTKHMTVCSTPQPDTWAKAKNTSLAMLAEVAMTSTAFTLGNSTSTGGGRKVDIMAKSSVGVSAGGDAKFVCLLESSTSATKLYIVNECSTPIQSLTTGNKVNFPAWRIEIEDPTT